VIEIVGPRTLVSFDGRVVELFGPDRSRRIHVSQILSAEIGRGGLLREDGPMLDLRLVDGRRVSVRFAEGRRLEDDLRRLVAMLLSGDAPSAGEPHMGTERSQRGEL
jgi:hypothetical protein